MANKIISNKITWLHLGAGNIFRVFIAAVQQDLIESGLAQGDLAVGECFDEEIIPAVFTPHDNVTLGVTLHTDGRIEEREITAVKEAINAADGSPAARARLHEVVADEALQLISLTITEKGYAVDAAKTCPAPSQAKTALEQLCAALLARYEASQAPLALVSMDNIAKNGDVLKAGICTIAQLWEENGGTPKGFREYVSSLSYPWTMIDKITPYPSHEVALKLTKAAAPPIIKTQKGTVTAHFVNAEAAQYLVMENDFPNGCPAFEKLAAASGVYLTDRETVRKVEHMKVCACLNPLHTLLGLGGMLLGYPTIAACMRDESLVGWARLAAAEALPAVAHPGIIDPQKFLDEVLTQRFPNPFIPDTPARIVTDSSQKIPVRFGQTLLARQKAGMDTDKLEAIPLLAALWLRYRMAIKDDGTPFELSPDPLAPPEAVRLEGMQLGEKAVDLRPIFSNAQIFGVDLYAAGLGEKAEKIFYELAGEKNAVARVFERLPAKD
jgi:fructuronate reductase